MSEIRVSEIRMEQFWPKQTDPSMATITIDLSDEADVKGAWSYSISLERIDGLSSMRGGSFIAPDRVAATLEVYSIAITHLGECLVSEMNRSAEPEQPAHKRGRW